MRGMKNKKLKNALSITGYFLLVIAICVSASIVFHNTYYESVYISGGSMSPTLSGCNILMSTYGVEYEEDGSTADYGIVDTHDAAKKGIKRFSIVSTYFPDDFYENGTLNSSSNLKIKRVVALPNETFKIEKSKLYIKQGEEFTYVPYTFDTTPKVEEEFDGKDIAETTLGEDEYWVLGDHRNNSRDSGRLYKDTGDVHKSAIKKNYISGVLVAIEGQGTLKLVSNKCERCNKEFDKDHVICPNCTTKLTRKFDLINKKTHWPKYF